MDRGDAHLSDEALLARARRSDREALGLLYDRVAGPAYALALRVVRDAALAERIVEDAFLAVSRSARPFPTEQAHASAWFMRLVHGRAVDAVRREQRGREEPLTAAEPAAGGRDELRLERERVREALRRLPDREREAIALAYFGGYTQAQLAKRLDQPLGVVTRRMFVGLARFRMLLQPSGREEGPWTTPRSPS